MKITRREFLKGSMATGAFLAAGGLGNLLWPRSAYAFAQSPQLTKWNPTIPFRNLGGAGIPVLSSVADPFFGAGTKFYRVTEGEFTDQLHPALPPTRLWGYWDTANPVQRHLAGVIVANRGTPARIRFTNTLPSTNLVPVDATVQGANQAQNRTAVHLHGGLVPWISDGGPLDWWSPGGAGYSTGLSFQNGPGSVLDNIAGTPMVPGQADFYYPFNQSARLLWYHDHAHGITRLNAYAGLASACLILDPVEAGYVAAGKIPDMTRTIPLIWQDKTFVDPATIGTSDPGWATKARADVQGLGSLWYAHTYDPMLFRLLRGTKYLTPPDPSVIPEFFGDTMLCNGTVYPLLEVQAKPYRFMMLNACNSRFLNINIFSANTANPDGIDLDPTQTFPVNPAGPNMIQIGNESGFLLTETTHVSPKPFNAATLTGNLILGNAERADVIIDFTGLAGQEFILYNDAPGPFPGGAPTNDYYLGNPLNPVQPLPGTGPDTRQILRIKVVAPVGAVPVQPTTNILNPLSIDPPLLVPPGAPGAPIIPPANIPVRSLTLNENFDQYGRLQQMLGTTKPNLVTGGFGIEHLAAPTEVVLPGATEVWKIFNLSADTHPIHFHLVNVQVLSRQPFRLLRGRFTPTGAARGPEANEIGWKETVKMHPGEVITLIMKFDLDLASVPFTVPSSARGTMPVSQGGFGLPAGKTYHEFVWHCHILEHEEHDMMRPLIVQA